MGAGLSRSLSCSFRRRNRLRATRDAARSPSSPIIATTPTSLQSPIEEKTPKDETQPPLKDFLNVNKYISQTWQPQYWYSERGDMRFDAKRKYHAVLDSPYVLPADLPEQDRLELQHIIYRYSFKSLFHMPIKEILNNGGKVLDVGCGPGAWAREVAREYPKAEVHGVDMAASLFEEVEMLPNMTFVAGNVLEKLPYDDNTFDAVYQRLMLLSIPKDKWMHVISELMRVLKPGGYLELVEVELEAFNLGPTTAKLHNGWIESMKMRGIDTDAALRLNERIQKCGLELVKTSICSFAIGWGGRKGGLHLLNTQALYTSLKPFLSRVFELDPGDYDELVKQALAQCRAHHTYTNAYAVVGKKPCVVEEF